MKIKKNKLDVLQVNTNKKAIDLLKENPDKNNWKYLSENSNAIELLKENPEIINWKHLSSNPSIIINS